MRRVKKLVHTMVLAAVVAVSPLFIGGCEIEIIEEDRGSQLESAIVQIAYGVVDLVEYFD